MGFEPATLRMEGTELITESTRPTYVHASKHVENEGFVRETE